MIFKKFTQGAGLLLLVLWACTLTAQPVKLFAEFKPGKGHGFGITAINTGTGLKLTSGNDTYFVAYDSITGGPQIWVTDGTLTNTELIVSGERNYTYSLLIDGGDTDEIMYLGNELGNSVVGSIHKETHKAFTVHKSPALIHSLCFMKGAYYFADDTKLYKVLPGKQPAVLVKQFGDFYDIRAMNALEDKLILIGEANGNPHLIVSDGTADGSKAIYQLNSGSESSSDHYMRPAGGKMFFFYSTLTRPYTLYVTDGTTAGTQPLKTFEQQYNRDLVRLGAIITDNGLYYFSGITVGNSQDSTNLWVSDGTVAGTRQLYPSDGIARGPQYFTKYKGKLYFSMRYNTALQRGIFVTDGTPEGTKAVVNGDLDPALNGFNAGAHLTVFKDTLFFTGSVPDKGVELWKSTGTVEGTTCVETVPGKDNFFINQLMPGKDVLFLIALLPETGLELFTYDNRLINPTNNLQDALPLAAFPVPFTDLIQLQLGDDLEPQARVLLYDGSGSNVLQTTWTGDPLEVSHLTPGWYVLQVIHAQGTKTLKLVKE